VDRHRAGRRQPAAARTKTALEKLAERIAPNEIFTFGKFLFLSGVILPILPNQEFGPFHINPFKTWLVVVAISTVSYASYVLQKLTKGQGGVVLARCWAGAYSSTVTDCVMARRQSSKFARISLPAAS